MRTLLIAAFCLSPGAGEARLGETPEQCATRYGEPSGEKGRKVVYRKNGFAIAAWFHAGKCDCIVFRKEIDPGLDLGEEISEPEIEALLEANRGDGKWTKAKANQWAIGEERIAIYLFSRNDLVIATLAGAEHWMKDQAAKKKANLKDF